MPVRRADDTLYTLATNASATGPDVRIKGGTYQFFVSGTPGGSTISLQIKTPNGAYSDVQVFTGAQVKFTVLPGNQSGIGLPAGIVRMAATGGSPSGINASLAGLG